MRFQELPTPVYVIDEARLRANLLILSELEKRSGCRILGAVLSKVGGSENGRYYDTYYKKYYGKYYGKYY